MYIFYILRGQYLWSRFQGNMLVVLQIYSVREVQKSKYKNPHRIIRFRQPILTEIMSRMADAVLFSQN
jgi:hypothetical protein